MIKIKRAYNEILEVINQFPKEEYEKIPNDIIEYLKNNLDTNYKFVYDSSVPYEKQNISREAKGMLLSLYIDYFISDAERKIVDEILKINKIKSESEKQKKYTNKASTNLNVQNDSGANNYETVSGVSSEESKEIAITKRESIWSRVLKFLRKFIEKNKKV